MNHKFQEAINAIRANNKTKARQLLATILKNDPQDKDAWLLLSYAISMKEHKIECLHRVLKIDPYNEIARKRLAVLNNSEKVQSSPSSSSIQTQGEHLDLFQTQPEGVNDKQNDLVAKSQIENLTDPASFTISKSEIPPLDSLIKQWFSVLSYRESKVLEYLYLDVNKFSLSAVSRIVSVPQQKVVEIEKRAIEKLRQPPVYSIIEPLATWLFSVLGATDKLSESELNATLRRELVVGQIDPLGIVKLLSTLQNNPVPTKHISEKASPPPSAPTPSSTIAASQQPARSSTHKITTSNEKPVILQDDKTPIKALGLSRRVYNALLRGGVKTVGELVSLKPERLLTFRNIGDTSLAEIDGCLNKYLATTPHLVQNDQPESLLDKLPVEIQENPRPVESVMPIAALGLSIRSYNALVRGGIVTIGQLTSLSETQLLRVKNIGDKSFREIQSRLKAYLTENPEVSQPHAVQEIHVQSSPSAIVPELLDQVATVPIDKISIERVGLSSITIAGLNRQGIDTIGQLLQHTDKFVKDGSIGKSLNHYLTWLIAQDETVWADEIANVGISPLFKLALAETTVEAMIGEWLSSLTKRERDVVKGRFALQGKELTLQEIGKQLGITRERVRQIQKKALRKLENRYSTQSRKLLKPLLIYLQQVFIEHGGLLSQSEILTTLESSDVIHLGSINPIGTVLLLCEMGAQFIYFKEQQFAALSQYPARTIKAIQASLLEILEKKLTAVSGDVLLTEFKKTEIYAPYKNWQTDYPDDFFMACLRVHPEVEQLDSGLYTLAKGSKKRLGAIVSALRKIGEPAHYSVIAEKTNELLPPDQQFTVRDVHAWLGRYSDVFVWVRLRGTYGLKEWGLELDLSYVDACAQILENEGHPLTRDQILARMPEMRQFFDESSVLITLATHERFRSFSNNRYGLVEWTTTQSKTDFVDLFGTQLARQQAELDQQNRNVEIDTQKEVNTIRKLGLDFFSD